MGIDLGEITQLFHVHPLLNREYVSVTETEGKFTLAKKWSKVSLAVAPQTIVENIKVHKRALAEYRSFEEVFTRNSTVFMMNNVYYGSQGTIVDPTIRSARLKSKSANRLTSNHRITCAALKYNFNFCFIVCIRSFGDGSPAT